MKIRFAMIVVAVIAAVALAVWFGRGEGTTTHTAGATPGSPLAGSVGGAAARPAAPVEVPLRVVGGHLVVPVDVGAREPMGFIISNGSGVLVLSETAAGHLGASPELSLGGLPVPTDGFVAAGSDDRFIIEGETMGGLIAGNMLNQFEVLVDVPGQRLVLEPAGSEVAWEGVVLSEPVPIRLYHGYAMSFDVELDGNRYPATLELGLPTLVVNEALETAAGLASEDVTTLSLGGATLADLPVHTRDLTLFSRWDPDNNGFVLLGAPTVYDCVLAISYVHQELRTCVR